MAAGDIAYDTDPVRRAGNLNEIHGTIEVDGVARVYAILNTKQHIYSARVTPVDQARTVSVGINLGADFSTAAQGSLAVHSNGPLGTCRFAVQYN